MNALNFLVSLSNLVSILPAEEAETFTLVDWLIPIAIIVVLIIVNGVFVAAEFAIIGVRPSQLEAIVQETGNASAKTILETATDQVKQDRYIATAQLGITIASLGLAMYAEPAIEHLLVGHIENFLGRFFEIDHEFAVNFTTFAIVLPFLTYLHVVVGEMIPKAFALSQAVNTAMRLQGPMTFFRAFLSPLVTVLNWIGNSLLGLLNLPPAQPRPHSLEEIEHLVIESAEGGFIDEDEEEIIKNIFDFSERRVGHVMTPRPKVESFLLDTSIETIIAEVAESTHTRFPVYDKEIDNIAGILHMRDLIPWTLNPEGEFVLADVLGPAPVVTENTMVEELLERFREEHVHMAIVLAERGGLAGVVTLEDLVEEVVGEVRDEFDVEHEPIFEIEPGIIEVDGEVLVEDLKEKGVLGETLNLPDVETVGGLIVTRLGRPAQVGDECIYTGEETNDAVTFTVIDVDGLAVIRARMTFDAIEEPPKDAHH